MSYNCLAWWQRFTGFVADNAHRNFHAAGENQTPAPLPTQALAFIQRTMEEAYTIMGCSGYARIDGFYQSITQSPTGQERVIILEFNTLPGMTPATCLFHQAAEMGLRPMEFVDLLVELGLEKHKKTNLSTSTTTSTFDALCQRTSNKIHQSRS